MRSLLLGLAALVVTGTAAVVLTTSGDARADRPDPGQPKITTPGVVALSGHPAGVVWPTTDWPAGQLPGDAQAKLDALLDDAVAGKVTGTGQTRGVVVIQGGRLVAERYGEGFDEDSLMISWSMAKSVTAALVGIAVLDGKLTLESPLDIRDWAPDDRRRKITISQALQMTDGLAWREDNYGDVTTNDAALMLFGEGREDVVAFAGRMKQKHDPGTAWNYSSGTSNLIAATLARSLGPPVLGDRNGAGALRNFIGDRLFKPLGMRTAAPEFDAAGNFYGSSLVHATARDWAKFGYLHLRDGMWDGTRILPEGWVDYVRRPASAKQTGDYGAHWWLSPANGAGLLKACCHDAFSAEGFQGQVVLVIPSKDAVIVRLGLMDDGAGWEPLGAWLEAVSGTLPDRGADRETARPPATR
jgi:CubicO group peptidase (beta-lactamase class C family)